MKKNIPNVSRLARYFLFGLLVTGVNAASAAEWAYVARPGDNLWNITERYLKDIRYVSRLQSHNGIADPCDIAACPHEELWCQDCNDNGMPDVCDPDCDSDGTPDDCETADDQDGDGVMDCMDLCPETTPRNACQPAERVTCLTPSGFRI